jgi:hypothetical protein
MKLLFSHPNVTALFISTSSLTTIHKYDDPVKNRLEVVFNGQFCFNDLVKIKLDLSQIGVGKL